MNSCIATDKFGSGSCSPPPPAPLPPELLGKYVIVQQMIVTHFSNLQKLERRKEGREIFRVHHLTPDAKFHLCLECHVQEPRAHQEVKRHAHTFHTTSLLTCPSSERFISVLFQTVEKIRFSPWGGENLQPSPGYPSSVSESREKNISRPLRIWERVSRSQWGLLGGARLAKDVLMKSGVDGLELGCNREGLNCQAVDCTDLISPWPPWQGGNSTNSTTAKVFHA